MGLFNFGQFFGGKPLAATDLSGLSATDRQDLGDIERIARTLAEQGGAPGEDWPFFLAPAESLVRASRRWSEAC